MRLLLVEMKAFWDIIELLSISARFVNDLMYRADPKKVNHYGSITYHPYYQSLHIRLTRSSVSFCPVSYNALIARLCHASLYFRDELLLKAKRAKYIFVHIFVRNIYGDLMTENWTKLDESFFEKTGQEWHYCLLEKTDARIIITKRDTGERRKE